MSIEEVVRYATDAQREKHSQVVHMPPAHLRGRSGRYHRITRTTLVKDSCTARSLYLPLAKRPAEFGIVTYNGRCSAVVREESNDSWEAVEAEPEWSHQRMQADLLRGGNA